MIGVLKARSKGIRIPKQWSQYNLYIGINSIGKTLHPYSLFDNPVIQDEVRQLNKLEDSLIDLENHVKRNVLSVPSGGGFFTKILFGNSWTFSDLDIFIARPYHISLQNVSHLQSWFAQIRYHDLEKPNKERYKVQGKSLIRNNLDSFVFTNRLPSQYTKESKYNEGRINDILNRQIVSYSRLSSSSLALALIRALIALYKASSLGPEYIVNDGEKGDPYSINEPDTKSGVLCIEKLKDPHLKTRTCREANKIFIEKLREKIRLRIDRIRKKIAGILAFINHVLIDKRERIRKMVHFLFKNLDDTHASIQPPKYISM